MKYTGFIYEWTNLINNQKYVGSHLGDTEDGYIGSGKKFKQAISEFGVENFQRTILEYTRGDKKTLLLREQHYLDLIDFSKNTHYNISRKAGGGKTMLTEEYKAIWSRRSDAERSAIGQKTKRTKARHSSQTRSEWIERMRQGKLVHFRNETTEQKTKRIIKHKEAWQNAEVDKEVWLVRRRKTLAAKPESEKEAYIKSLSDATRSWWKTASQEDKDRRTNKSRLTRLSKRLKKCGDRI